MIWMTSLMVPEDVAVGQKTRSTAMPSETNINSEKYMMILFEKLKLIAES